MDVSVNYLALLAATASSMMVGTFWYGPVFGKQWTKLMGFTAADMEKAAKEGMGKVYAVAALGAFIMAYVVKHFIVLLDITDAAGAFRFAFWAWLGLIAMTQLNSVLWEGRSKKLFVINTLGSLVSLVVMTLILTLWK